MGRLLRSHQETSASPPQRLPPTLSEKWCFRIMNGTGIGAIVEAKKGEHHEQALGTLIAILVYAASVASAADLAPCKWMPLPVIARNCKPLPPAPCGLKGQPPCPKVTPPPTGNPPPPPTK